MPELYMRTPTGQLVPVELKDTETQTPNATYAFGPGGLFNTPGLNPRVVNAMIMPTLGIQSRLPVTYTNQMLPLTPIFTGVTDVTGSFSANPCGDTKVAGLAKLCNLSTVFGYISMKTPTIQLTRVGQLSNRGYFTDFSLMGDPTNPTIGAGSVPTLPQGGMSDAITNEVQKQMMQFRVSWARTFSKLIYAGNPVNNLGDGYKEFRGLDILINKGYQDAENATLCPAADSMVQTFSSTDFTTSSSAATDIVALIQDMWRQIMSLADRTGLAPLQLAIAMPRDMFYELTKRWPIAYATTATTVIAAGQTNTALHVDAMDSANLRDSMRNGQYLMVNGVQVPVIVDDAITQTVVADGIYEASIYFVPLTVLGNTPATYVEYFNFDGDGAFAQAAQVLGIPGKYFTVDNGRRAAVRLVDDFCVALKMAEMSRVRLDTPFLAARLTNVRYTTALTSRSPYYGDGSFYNGGHTSTPSAPSFWPPNVYGGSQW